MIEDKLQRLSIAIILFNCKDDVKTYEEFYQKELQAIDFSVLIEAKFKGFIQKDGRHLSVIAPNYKIYCGTDTELTVSREIDIYGEAGLYEFISLAKENAWAIYDKGIDDLIDLDFPKKYNYLEYKALKQK